MDNDPIVRFKSILSQAEQLGIPLFNAAALATAGADRQPSVRMLLLKDIDERGFVFYTNLTSRKAHQLSINPQASACFWWAPLGRQVRVEGRVERVSDQEADDYFASRPRGSQIGAWASQQSSEIPSRQALLATFAATTADYEGRTVPRPPFWSGYRLIPESIEFWQEQPDRLHERELYTRLVSGWTMTLLAP